MTRSILALDLAKVTGYAHWAEGQPKPNAGVLDVSDKVKYPTVGDRLASLDKWLLAKTREWALTDIVCESPVIGGGKEGKIIWLVGCYALVMKVGAQCRTADGRKVDVTKIRNDSFFVHWCGTNNIEGENRKTQSVLECQRRGFPLITDHNTADAMGVLSLRCAMLNLSPPWDYRKSPGPLFTGSAAPAGTRISKSNKIAANIAINKGLSFDRGS